MVPFDTPKLAHELRKRGKLTAERAEGIAASPGVAADVVTAVVRLL